MVANLICLSIERSIMPVRGRRESIAAACSAVALDAEQLTERRQPNAFDVVGVHRCSGDSRSRGRAHDTPLWRTLVVSTRAARAISVSTRPRSRQS